jgi:hypothetical protein
LNGDHIPCQCPARSPTERCEFLKPLKADSFVRGLKPGICPGPKILMKTQIRLIFLGLTTLTFSAVLVVIPFVLANSKTIQHPVTVKGIQTEPLSPGETATTLRYDTSCERAEVLLARHFAAAWQNH